MSTRRRTARESVIFMRNKTEKNTVLHITGAVAKKTGDVAQCATAGSTCTQTVKNCSSVVANALRGYGSQGVTKFDNSP